MRVTIPQGSSLSQIADLLERSGVSSTPASSSCAPGSRAAAATSGRARYKLRKDMSFAAALDALEEGVPPDVVQVGIPEGLSRKEIAPLTGGLRGSYVRATRRSPSLDPRDYGAKGATSLEGFLFPATYELKKGQRWPACVDQQLAHVQAQLRQGRPELRQAQEPHALRRADHRVAGRARGDAGQGAADHRLGDLQPAPRRHPARHRCDHALCGRQLEAAAAGSPSSRTRARTTRACTRACRPARSATRAWPRSRRPPTRPRPTTSSTWSSRARCGKHNFAKTDAEFQGYVNEYNRARDENGGKSPTTC